MSFSSKIIKWYEQNKRELPWRNTKDPYKIWLSEIILQQTRVEQGLPYYIRFLKNFPTINHLAKAPEVKVMKLWQGLGYYSRARNLHATAKEVVNIYKGKFPEEHYKVIRLKGIGDYTAAAILSFAFNKAYPVVDGNVYRLLSRYFGITTPIDSARAKKEFYALAQAQMEGSPAALFNQAIMEFGAVQCKPFSPDCSNCVLMESCFAYRNHNVNRLPVKAKTLKIRKRYFHYLCLEYKGKLLLKKRTGNDIWRNLYDMPLVETKKRSSDKKLMLTKEWTSIVGTTGFEIKSVTGYHKHQLSHQTIYAKFYEIEWKKPLVKMNGCLVISKKQLDKYPVPKLIERYFKAVKF